MADKKGRGSSSNASGRFNLQKIEMEINADNQEWFAESLLRTQFRKDFSRSIVNENKSPDIGFRYSLNAYRGCEHGCAYCYARPTHEYFGLSAGQDFESIIFYKENAPELLRARLMSPRWQPETIFMSGVTDCYQPIERKFELTRGCLRVLHEFGNPVALITKNFLVARDVDILAEMASYQAAKVFLSITTLNADLARKLEPRTSSPQARLKAIEILSQAGVPVGVNIAPVIPGLNDHEIPTILQAAANAGARAAGFISLRLPYSVKTIFTEWLKTHYPDRSEKVLNLIRSIRGGELNDPEFGSRMRGTGPVAEQMRQVFDLFSRKYGFNCEDTSLSCAHFRRPGDQLQLF